MDLEPLYALIRHYEGLRLKPYRCPAGVPTIGYGTTGISMQHKAVTKTWAEERMQADAAEYVFEAVRLSPLLFLPWHSNRLCAIADFCYNLGSTRYAASTLRRRVNVGDWDAAAYEIKRWVYGGGRKLPGLVARRESEADLLLL